MAANCLPYEPRQMILLPEAIQDWLPEGPLAHFISDTVDTLDLAAFHARYEQDGPRNQPFHPAMMVKAALRLRHGAVRAGRAPGARAGPGEAWHDRGGRHPGQCQREPPQIDTLLKRAQQADEAEREEPELDIAAEIRRREARLAAISAARQRLEQRQQEAGRQRGREPDDPPRGGRYKRAFGVPEDKAQDNFTNCASDAGELPPMLQAVRENLGRLPARVLADTGYKSEAVFEALAGNGCELIVALGREGKHPLRFDPTLTCAVERRDLPAGDRPARRLSFPPVAIGAAVEVTRRLEPLV